MCRFLVHGVVPQNFVYVSLSCVESLLTTHFQNSIINPICHDLFCDFDRRGMVVHPIPLPSTSTLLRIQLNNLIEAFDSSRYHFAECTIEFSTLEKLLDIVFKDWYRTVSGDYSEPDFEKLKVFLLTRKFSIDDLEITIVNRKMAATYFINDVSHSEGLYIPYEIF